MRTCSCDKFTFSGWQQRVEERERKEGGSHRTIASIERGRWTGKAVKRSGTPVSKRKCLQKSRQRERESEKKRKQKKGEFARDADSAEHDVDAVNDDDDDDDDDDDHGWPHFVPF